MSARNNFDAIVEKVRQLVLCDAALLIVECPISDGPHPLLALLQASLTMPDRRYGSLDVQVLLHDEAVRALCDIACRSGSIQYLNAYTANEGKRSPRHIAVVPIESEAGFLGYLLLVDTSPTGFSAGEMSLLNQQLPLLGADMDQALQAFVLDYLVRARKSSEIEEQQRDDWQRDIAGALHSVSMVGHELRTPLTAIKGYAGLLQAYGPNEAGKEVDADVAMTPARQQHYLNMILEETQRLEILIGDLLDVSRLQSGKLTLRYVPVDVRDLCQRAVRLARVRLAQQPVNELSIDCTLPLYLPTLQADPNRLLQILNNLLENAVKYSPRGGCVELIACPALGGRQNAITFIVRDHGIGIPAGQQARLFKPFSRIDSPQAHQVQGVGLGLYITHMLVQAMHGTIELTSREGVGTTISVSFPVVAPVNQTEFGKDEQISIQSATQLQVLSV